MLKFWFIDSYQFIERFSDIGFYWMNIAGPQGSIKLFNMDTLLYVGDFKGNKCSFLFSLKSILSINQSIKNFINVSKVASWGSIHLLIGVCVMLFLGYMQAFFFQKQCRNARSGGNRLSNIIWLIYTKLILVLVEISFLSLASFTPTLWLAFFYISLWRVLKFSWLSMVTPSNLRQSEDSMVFPWKCNGISLTALLCKRQFGIYWGFLSGDCWKIC